MTVIAGDIGGTKTLLGWFDTATQSRGIRIYENRHFADFESVLLDFLSQETDPHLSSVQLTLAIAGPVDRRQCQMTNLPWKIDADTLQSQFGFGGVELLNDLGGSAWSLPGMSSTDALHFLRGTALDFTHPIAILSVGTGLGEAALVPDSHQQFRVLASEGGHKQFAPFESRTTQALLQAYATGQNAISWESWFSGVGLPHFFQALFPEMEAPTSAEITRQALLQSNSPAGQCVDLLVKGLMAEAGNMALQYLAWGGVVLAGGVVNHLQPWLNNPDYLSWLARKDAHSRQLNALPVALCTDLHAALKGAGAYGWNRKSTLGFSTTTR